MPNQGGSGKRLVFDIENRGQPIAYKKSEQFKNLGMYGESDDITGGMGLDGVAGIREVRRRPAACWSRSARRATSRRVRPGAECGRGANVARSSTRRDRSSTPRSCKPEHPIFYGYDKKTSSGALRQRSAAERADRRQSVRRPPPPGPPPTPQSVLMRYPGGDDHVLSGLMRGANEIATARRSSIEPSGKGRVILFAGNPCYRWQNFGEFNMLFNTVLNYNDIKTDVPKPAGTAPAQI